MNRKDFLQKTALLASGMLLSNTSMKAVVPDKKINIGIIGCGDRGKGMMEVINQMPEQFKIFGICDVLDFRLTEALPYATSAALKTKDYRHILDNRSIDAVLIATPLNMHFQIAKDALLSGKHVYLEKTMTYNISEAIQLIDLTKQYPDLILEVGHQYRYTPLYFKVKEMIANNYLGKVTQIDCRWDRNANWRRPLPDPSLERQINWRMYKEYSGGLVAELLSHQIDFINWAFDTHPDEILGTGGIDYYKDGRETYDNVQVMLRYKKKGMIGNFGATCGNGHDGFLFKIKGTRGMVSLLINEGYFYPEKSILQEYSTVDGVTGATKITINKDGGIPIQVENSKDGSWYALQDFYNCILNKRIPISNVYTGARTAYCVHLANDAIYKNGIEKWRPELV